MPNSIKDSNLTPREQEVCEFISQGFNTSEIGERMGITGHTVQVHLASIFKKTDTHSRLQLVLLWSKRAA